jgi:hypothetical protein
MKNASARPVDDVASAPRVFHRMLKQAAAFGRPSVVRRKRHERNERHAFSSGFGGA